MSAAMRQMTESLYITYSPAFKRLLVDFMKMQEQHKYACEQKLANQVKKLYAAYEKEHTAIALREKKQGKARKEADGALGTLGMSSASASG